MRHLRRVDWSEIGECDDVAVGTREKSILDPKVWREGAHEVGAIRLAFLGRKPNAGRVNRWLGTGGWRCNTA